MSKPPDPSTALAVSSPAPSVALMSAPGDFGPEHMRIVRDAFAPTATQAEFEVMWAGAKARRLDPVRKQIHFVKRFDSMRGCDVWSSQVSIDGFRGIAEETGKYDGQDEPEYDYDSRGALILARVRVYRKDIGRAFVGVARWAEYVQTKSGGEPTHMWKKMAHTMLSKCAEALALRKAFPEPLAGLYTGEEMMHADNEGNLTPTRVRESDVRATVIDAEHEPALPDVNVRADAFEARIREAVTLEELARVATDIGRDPHERMRADMLGMAEARRCEMASKMGDTAGAV